MRKKLIALAAVTCLAMTCTAQAYTWNQPSTWTGAVDTEWDNSGNWDNGKPGDPWRPAYDGDANKWWADTDGYINAGDVITNTYGEFSLRGNSNPSEIFMSGGSVSFSGMVNLQMMWVHQSGGSWSVGNYMICRNGGYQNGGGATLGSGHELSGSALLTAGNIELGLDLPSNYPFPATILQHDTSSVTVDDVLKLVSVAGAGPATYTVDAGATLDVDLDSSSTGITVNSDGTLTANGTVTTSDLTINGTGQVTVGGSTLVILGDKRTKIQGYIDSGNLDGILNPDLVNGNTVVTPEPATMAFLALGGLALLRRRR